MLQSVVSSVMTDPEKVLYQKKWSDTLFRSSEECHYHTLFMDAYENPGPILKNVGRWAERPEEIGSFS
jgi:asparagine synthase (glutamine-hydrolysing)